jgi:ferredoxin-2, mitochondrial
MLARLVSRAARRRVPAAAALSGPAPRRTLVAASRPARHMQSSVDRATARPVNVTFVDTDGERVEVRAYEGENILEVAHQNDIELEGACEGSLACSTCHVILPDEYYDRLEEPNDEENDMLDMAFGLTETSRLGCQVHLSPEMEGLTITIPSATRNMSVDK